MELVFSLKKYLKNQNIKKILEKSGKSGNFASLEKWERCRLYHRYFVHHDVFYQSVNVTE